MAQNVRMPDGVVVAFPDDMPREEIRALIEEKFPDVAQSQSALKPELTGTTRQGDYNRELRHIRETQFPDMTDAQWEEYSKVAFAPYSNTELSQHGALFGLTDEIASGLSAAGSQVKRWMGDENSPDFGTAFNDYQGLEHARRDVGREQAGISGGVAEVLGGLGAIRAPVAPLAAAAGPAPSLGGQMLRGAASGATLGAVYGAGAADENRLQEGLVSGVVGGALGAAIPVLARGVSAGYNTLAGAMQSRNAAQTLGVQPGTARYLQETLAADDALSPAGIGRVQAAGQEGMVADAGQSARNALDHAIQSSGRAGRVATEEIGGRVTRDAQAIQDALDTALGKPQGVQTTRTNIRQGSAAARGNAYDAAYNAPIDYSSPEGVRLEGLLNRLRQSDIEAANEMMRMEGFLSRQILAQIGQDGRVTFTRMPDVRQIDYITRALNDVADANVGKGAMGGLANKGRVYGNLARDIRDELRQAVPEYGQALDTAADPIRRSQAVQNGADWLKASREQVAEWTQGMTQAEREAFLQGIRSNIDETLANVSRAVADGDMPAREAIKALKLLTTRAAREKLRLAIGNQRQADALLDELDRAAKSFELRADVADRSTTFQRQEMNRRADILTNPDDVVGTLKKGKPVNALQRGVQAMTGTTPEDVLRRKDAMMEETARFLTRRGPDAQNSLAGMARYNAQTSQRNQGTVTLRQLLESGGANVAHQLTRYRKSWLPL